MAETQPRGEQLRFLSSKTGTHNLDTYLESAERGSKSIGDMLGDIFDSSGNFDTTNFEFQFDASDNQLEVRVGGASNSYVNITSFFNIRGTYSSSSTTYKNFDLVTRSNGDVHIVHGLSSNTATTTFADDAAVNSSSNTKKLIDVSGAATQATAAASSATAAASSATSAASSATTATTKASEASSSASTASGHKDTATTKAGEAATSATNAATSASTASTQATNASSSASAASTSASNAATSATSAASSLSTFQGQYHGAASSNPSSNLNAGDLYFNTSSGLKVYNGSAWEDIKPTSSEQTNINTVSGVASNVTTVAGISSDVSSVAGIAGDVTSLANSLEKTFIVTVANVGGTNVFVLDGVNKPALQIVRGNEYIFDVSNASVSGHPLAFRDSSDNSWTSGVTVTGTAGNAGATVKFEVPSNAPSTLKYYCTSHGNAMGNSITVSDSAISTVATNIASVNSVASNQTAINNVNSISSAISAVNSNASNINNVSSNISGVNSFADRYRIASSAPSSSLDQGDLYFDTTANELKVYKSSGWAAAGSTVNGTAARFQYTSPAPNGATTFSGNDDNGVSLAYDAGFIDVYLNGVKQLNGVDVNVTSGTSVVFSTSVSVGDIIDIVAYGTFALGSFAASALTSGTVDLARLPLIPTNKLQTNVITINGSAVQLGGSTTIADNSVVMAIALG